MRNAKNEETGKALFFLLFLFPNFQIFVVNLHLLVYDLVTKQGRKERERVRDVQTDMG